MSETTPPISEQAALKDPSLSLIEPLLKYKDKLNVSDPNIAVDAKAVVSIALGLPEKYRTDALNILAEPASVDTRSLRETRTGPHGIVDVQNQLRGAMTAIALASTDESVHVAAINALAKGFSVPDLDNRKETSRGHRMITQSISTIAAVSNQTDVLHEAVRVLSDYATRPLGHGGYEGKTPLPSEQAYASEMVANLTPQDQAPTE